MIDRQQIAHDGKVVVRFFGKRGDAGEITVAEPADGQNDEENSYIDCGGGQARFYTPRIDALES